MQLKLILVALTIFGLIVGWRQIYGSAASKENMHMKVMLLGLTIFGLIVAGSAAMPASNSAEARNEQEPAERAEQSSAEEARYSDGCLKTLCG
ncbi:hypothetical protein MRX96_047305 [Rhipicephalus microplus]